MKIKKRTNNDDMRECKVTIFHDHNFRVCIFILDVLQKTSKASGKNGKCTGDRLKRDIGEFVINLLITN